MRAPVTATVWQCAANGERERTPLAHGWFLDTAGAHEFIAHQMHILFVVSGGGGHPVKIDVVTDDGGDEPPQPHTVVGTPESVLDELDNPDQAAHAIASDHALHRIGRTRTAEAAS